MYTAGNSTVPLSACTGMPHLQAWVKAYQVAPALDLPYVGEDNEAIGRTAAENLLERNLKNFAWAPFWDDKVNEERCPGFSGCLVKWRRTALAS
jgi:DNA-binding LacI/PurR family transcriptional regulator